MFDIHNALAACRRLVSLLVTFSILLVSWSFAQVPGGHKYNAELVVSDGKKSVETDADLLFEETVFSVTPHKNEFKSSAKTFSYTSLKSADHSYSKKPMLSGGGAVATAILLGVFVVPFLFIKKKKHWMTVQTEKEFAVIKLGDNNWRQVVAELETHGVKVNDLKEVDK